MWTDLRCAIRSLLQARWFTVGAVLTFALGIGVNVAVFSAVDRMLFRKLPYERPQDLVVMRESAADGSQFYGTRRADLIGQRMWNAREPTEVVGILPPRFINATSYLDPKSDGIFLDFTLFVARDPRERAVPPTIRLKPGVSLALAQAEVDAMVAASARSSRCRRPGARQPSFGLCRSSALCLGPIATTSGWSWQPQRWCFWSRARICRA